MALQFDSAKKSVGKIIPLVVSSIASLGKNCTKKIIFFANRIFFCLQFFGRITAKRLKQPQCLSPFPLYLYISILKEV